MSWPTTREQLRKLSTKRLLNLFRIQRKQVYSADPERGAEEEDWDYLDWLKTELDTREHVPR